MRISCSRPARTNAVKRYDIGKLQSQEIANALSNRVSIQLSLNPMPPALHIEDQWQQCQEAIRTAASEVLGFTRPPKRNPWFDEEFRQQMQPKARQMLMQQRTRAASDQYNEIYKEKRREEHRILKKKKKQHEKRSFEEIERCHDRNETRKFYQKVKRSCQGGKPRT